MKSGSRRVFRYSSAHEKVLEKPKRTSKEKREMPFTARRRHQNWSAGVRYLKGLGLPGRFCVISVLDNHDFADAEDWPELVAAHARFVGDYNHQPHWAHRDRPGGRRAPLEVWAS
jgi:hypothetical protein